MKSYSSELLRAQTVDYERITRQIRWTVLGAVAVTLPQGQPQSLAMLGLLGVGVLYNLLRYNRWMMRQRWFSSRIGVMIADSLLVALLLLIVSRADTVYTGFLGLITLTSTYWYGLWGMGAVLGPQLVVLVAVASFPIFPPLVLASSRATVLAGLLLFIFGLLVERLTHVERLERSTLLRLDRDRMAEQDRLMAVVNSLPEAMAVVDEKGHITNANDALQELVGSKDSVKGQELKATLPLHHPVKGTLDWAEALRNSPQRHREYRYTGADQTEVSLDMKITPVAVGKAKTTNFIVVCRDITKEKSLDEEREQFIALASHQLRTPLTIIEGTLSTVLMPDTKLPEDSRKMLEQAYRNAQFLAGLVHDLTTLSEAQNDAIDIQVQPVDPSTLLEQLVSDYGPQADAKQLAMTYRLSPDTPSVLTTQRHVYEILRNFISNSLKYTKKGEVVLTAAPAQNGGVLFSVKDTGEGIAKADQEHLFSKFFQAEDFRTREKGGTGLGLYLCMELAERINGKIWCDSEKGHGSTFYLEVPPFSRLGRDQEKVVAAGISNLVDQI